MASDDDEPPFTLSKPIKRASSQRTIRPAPMGAACSTLAFRALTEPNDRLLSMLCLQTAHPTSCEAFCNLSPTANSAKPRCSRSWRASMVLPSGQDRVTDRSVTLLTSTVCQPEDATEPAQGVRGRDHSNGRQAPPERLSRSGPGRHVESTNESSTSWPMIRLLASRRMSSTRGLPRGTAFTSYGTTW
jgi:hypothetical protein